MSWDPEMTSRPGHPQTQDSPDSRAFGCLLSAQTPTSKCKGTFVLFFLNFYWSILALQCCVSFHSTAKWISYTYIYIYPLFFGWELLFWNGILGSLPLPGEPLLCTVGRWVTDKMRLIALGHLVWFGTTMGIIMLLMGRPVSLPCS